MRFGVCTTFESEEGFYKNLGNIKLINDIGYDYAEIPLVKLSELANDDFNKFKGDLQKNNINIEVCNILLPGNVKVVGDNINYKKIHGYLDFAMERASEIGVKVLVFGSGGSRYIPEGFGREDAWKQLVEFSKILAIYAKKYEINIVIENLRRIEYNFINTVDEALKLSNEVNEEKVNILVDYFHLTEEHENVDVILLGKGKIKHVHIAHQKDRGFLKSKDEYIKFIENLKTIKYDQRISIEGSTNNFYNDAIESLNILKELCEV